MLKAAILCFITSCTIAVLLHLKKRIRDSWGRTCCMISAENWDSSDFILKEAFSLHYRIRHLEAVSCFATVRG